MDNQITGGNTVAQSNPPQSNTNLNNNLRPRQSRSNSFRPRQPRQNPNKNSQNTNSNTVQNVNQNPNQRQNLINPNRNQQNPNNPRKNNFRNRNNRNINQNPNNNPNKTNRRQRFPNELYKTADARDWNSKSNYQFNTYTGSKVRLIPISGVEMVGTNCTVIEYENDIMIIDAGLGFANEDLMGIDAIVPNLNYLSDKLNRVRGLVITHGHTDHIGGLQYIYDKIGFPPIYAPRLAAEMIREKFREAGFLDRAKINEIDGDSSYYLGKFHLSHFRMNHTIMDNYGIVIDTPVGRIMTPSDYKFDLTPYQEAPSDYSKLTKLGDEGILLLMDESTNVKHKGWAPSESAIANDLENTIRDTEGRLIVGMFSTMISRIKQIMEIASRYNKKVAVLGRSMETNAKISHRLGYINVTTSTFISIDDINKYPDDQIIVLTTGSQGESNAALMRMGLDEHRKIKLKPSDTVVFSSSKIPGNEGKIDKVINLISRKGCRILTNDHLTLHASGHGCKEDHKLMLQLTKPKFLMPIHGDPSMLVANKEIAMELGMKGENVILSENGAVIELWPDGWQIVDKIDSTPLWVEGNRVGDFEPQIIEDRKAMADEGVIVITAKNFNSNQITSSDIEIISKGFFVQTKDNFIKSDLTNRLIESINRIAGEKTKESLKTFISRFVEREIEQKYDKKKPLIIVSVI